MHVTVKPEQAGRRLDHVLQEAFPQFSRARMQAWAKSGRVLVDGAATEKASAILRGGERISLAPDAPPPLRAEPEDLPVDILYEDDAVIAINKPAGLTVHAGAGAHSGTLVNRLVARFRTLSQVGGDQRPGIVHRLDKETSGVLLVARTDAAHRALAEQFATRTVDKVYLALVHGLVKKDAGRVETPITRDPVRRTRMTTKLEKGRSALTMYRVLRRCAEARLSYLEVTIGTGRTHQIRVHLASIGHPVVGDRLYGAPADADLGRNFLHAHRISFDSPATGERVTVEAALPAELEAFLEGQCGTP
ncbi:MAG: RluA family pseudouridine synthase [Bryobacteraceae bacterium]